MKRRAAMVLFSLGLGVGLARRARALIYLPENSLESVLVKADAVVIGTIHDFSEEANTANVDVEETLKGQAKGRIALSSVMLRVSAKERRPRFKDGDRVVLFLGPEAENQRKVIQSQTLGDEAEVKAMRGCIAEIMPMAKLLADLADPHVQTDEKALREALTKLSASKNAYTQILLGRLMGTQMAQQYKPGDWQDLIAAALASSRKELLQGAMTWAAKWETLPDSIRAELDKVAKDDREDVAKQAKDLLTGKR